MTTIPPQPPAEQPAAATTDFSWLGIAAAYVFAIAAWLTLATIIVRQSLP